MVGWKSPFGGFLTWWYPTTMGFPTKDDHFGVFWGYHHLRKHPYRKWLVGNHHFHPSIQFKGWLEIRVRTDELVPRNESDIDEMEWDL